MAVRDMGLHMKGAFFVRKFGLSMSQSARQTRYGSGQLLPTARGGGAAAHKGSMHRMSSPRKPALVPTKVVSAGESLVTANEKLPPQKKMSLTVAPDQDELLGMLRQMSRRDVTPFAMARANVQKFVEGGVTAVRSAALMHIEEVEKAPTATSLDDLLGEEWDDEVAPPDPTPPPSSPALRGTAGGALELCAMPVPRFHRRGSMRRGSTMGPPGRGRRSQSIRFGNLADHHTSSPRRGSTLDDPASRQRASSVWGVDASKLATMFPGAPAVAFGRRVSTVGGPPANFVSRRRNTVTVTSFAFGDDGSAQSRPTSGARAGRRQRTATGRRVATASRQASTAQEQRWEEEEQQQQREQLAAR
jgi:hypothetical protein